MDNTLQAMKTLIKMSDKLDDRLCRVSADNLEPKLFIQDLTMDTPIGLNFSSFSVFLSFSPFPSFCVSFPG